MPFYTKQRDRYFILTFGVDISSLLVKGRGVVLRWYGGIKNAFFDFMEFAVYFDVSHLF